MPGGSRHDMILRALSFSHILLLKTNLTTASKEAERYEGKEALARVLWRLPENKPKPCPSSQTALTAFQEDNIIKTSFSA